MNERIRNGIEKYRKGLATIVFVDHEGNAMPDITAKVTLTNHAFRHGANLFMLGELETDEKNRLYGQRFKDAFNLATLPFYWKDTEPERGITRYSNNSPRIYRRPAPDMCLEYCERNGIEPKAHCLAYDNETPSWVPDNVGDIKRLLDKRFRELAERYAARIPGWEVTNETLFARRPGNTVFYDEPDMLEWSFRLAEKHFPLNKLIINDAHCNIWNVFNGNRSQYYMQIERALRNGSRIDAIGMQFHMFYPPQSEQTSTAPFYDPLRLYDVMDRYADFGIPLQITEITLPAYNSSEEDESIQAELLRNLYSIWFSHEAMEAIIYWNLVDGYAFGAAPGDMDAGENIYRGGLLDFGLNPKPAYETVIKLFGEEWRTQEIIRSDISGTAAFRGFYGEYRLEIKADGKVIPVDFHFLRKGPRHYRIALHDGKAYLI